MVSSTIETGLEVSEEVHVLKKAEVVFFEMSLPFVRRYGVHIQVDSHF
jgi:hypothetical protein